MNHVEYQPVLGGMRLVPPSQEFVAWHARSSVDFILVLPCRFRLIQGFDNHRDKMYIQIAHSVSRFPDNLLATAAVLLGVNEFLYVFGIPQASSW